MERTERMPRVLEFTFSSIKAVVRNLRPTGPRLPRWDEYESY